MKPETTIAEVLARIEEKLELLASPLPALLTTKRAALELSVSASTLGRMIKDKQIGTVFLRGHRRVPGSEIRRLCTLDEKTARRLHIDKPESRTPSEMAEQVRAELRAERQAAKAQKKR